MNSAALFQRNLSAFLCQNHPVQKTHICTPPLPEDSHHLNVWEDQGPQQSVPAAIRNRVKSAGDVDGSRAGHGAHSVQCAADRNSEI